MTYTHDLHDALSYEQIGARFWKCGKSKFDKESASSRFIDGLADGVQIAEAFAEHFCKTCTSIYGAMLCIRGTSHGPVSVCLSVCLSVRLSVTSRCSTKTAKRRITQTTPHDSPGTLVFWCQRSPRNSTGGAKCRWGGSKSATFDK